ncbi:MAG: TAXI family TRAP transporter solute-binding subunit [Deltaproteobacteria bacterium]|nr:TAXI family TRAP transporter solute-binding subunit [Deltaproteobacteria bacterium]
MRFAIVAAVAVALVAVIWGILVLNPVPPRTVTMTTGGEGGAYHELGKRYRDILSRSGVKLRLLASAGGIENLRRLSDPRSGVSVGFAQGGATGDSDRTDLVSLGTVAYEPLWFFYRGRNPGRKLERLRGKRLSIGPEGSGTRDLAVTLLAANGIDRGVAQLLPLSAHDAGEQLLSGRIEAALMVAGWESPIVRRLLASKDVELVGFPRADAYTALYPFLNKVTVPAGVGDLAKDRPPVDMVLLAPKTSLVVRKDLHPAIQYLLLDAAAQIHSGAGIFQKAGQFPAVEPVDLPLSDTARQFHKTGRPLLQRYLPFWIAVFLWGLILLLIPVIAAFYPLFRIAPALYGWGMRRRIFRLYGELKFLEAELERHDSAEDTGDLGGQLEQLEGRANQLQVPLAYANLLYNLRRDIQLVRDRLAVRRAPMAR